MILDTNRVCRFGNKVVRCDVIDLRKCGHLDLSGFGMPDDASSVKGELE